ncbi:MAG: hypothetical protein HZA04_00425 [Nitrospinae bacterium]|nr:hypothetical protein [Nitrospinota bacterium]
MPFFLAAGLPACGTVKTESTSKLSAPAVNQATVQIAGNPERAYSFTPSVALGTDFSDPANAAISYVESLLNSNSPALTLKLNAASGGTQNTNGLAANILYSDALGNTYQPRLVCAIVVTSPYSGKPGTTFSAEVNDCLLHSRDALTGFDLTLSVRLNKTEG